MPHANLNKSLVMQGQQCPKRLWLALNAPEEGVLEGESPQMALGRVAGRIAQQRWPQGRCIPAGLLAEAAEDTQKQIHAAPPAQAIFEAAFVHGGVGIRADVLARNGKRAWDLVEVKTSTKKKPEHIDDCAIQAWVIEGTGQPLKRIQLALINTDFVYQGDGNYKDLFYLVDVTADVRERIVSLPDTIGKLQRIPDGKMPEISMGSHCKKPWPCPFQDYCNEAYSEYPVSILPGPGGKKLAAQLEEQGYDDLREVPLEILDKTLCRRIVHAIQTGKPFLSREAAADIPSTEFPRYYLDFETAAFPVPVWVGTRPYKKIPFQWSCHIDQESGATKHVSFLQLEGKDPSHMCAAQLVEALGKKGPIFTYGHFDRGVVNALAEQVPEYAPQLRAITERIVDVLPLVRAHYYHPDMGGSFSIKNVVPTIAPELGYDELDGVAEGNAAQMACWQIVTGEIQGNEAQEIIRQLDQYCALDTRALMAIVHHLEGNRT